MVFKGQVGSFSGSGGRYILCQPFLWYSWKIKNLRKKEEAKFSTKTWTDDRNIVPIQLQTLYEGQCRRLTYNFQNLHLSPLINSIDIWFCSICTFESDPSAINRFSRLILLRPITPNAGAQTYSLLHNGIKVRPPEIYVRMTWHFIIKNLLAKYSWQIRPKCYCRFIISAGPIHFGRQYISYTDCKWLFAFRLSCKKKY